MPDNIDRRIGNGGLLVPVLALALVLAAAAGGYVWFRMAKEQDARLPSAGQTIPVQAARPDEPVSVTMFTPGEGGLTTGTLQARRQPDSQSQARETLAAAFSDPRMTALPLMKEVALRSFFMDETGTAYVDLGLVSPGGARASAREELFALYAIVNTLMQNFDEIRKVRFLVEGKEDQTLAGHIDLSGTFTQRTDLVQPLQP